MAKYLDEIAIAVAVVATGGAALAALAPTAFGGLVGAATGVGATAGTAGAAGTVGAGSVAAGGSTAAGLGSAAADAALTAEAAAAANTASTGATVATSGNVAAQSAGAAAASEGAAGSAGLFGSGVTASEAIQGAGAVTAIGGGIQQRAANQDAVRAQKRSNMFAGRLRDLQTRREVLSQINSGRVEQASVANRAAQTGGTGSSGAAGSIASVGSQVGANISFLDQGKQLQSDIFGQAQRAQTAGERASMAGSVAKVGNYFGQGVFTDLFS